MATSGVTSLSTTRDEIITEAMEYLGVLAEGESPNANQLTSMSRTLNWLVKHIQQAHGGHLFTAQRWYVFLKKNQYKYTLQQGSSDKFCKASTFKNTFLSAAAASGASTVTVDSTAGIFNGDDIGIEVENNVMHWTTGDRFMPLLIENAYRRTKFNPATGTQGTDIPLSEMSQEEYEDLSIKTSDGAVNQFYYDRQRLSGDLFIWPQTSDETTFLNLWVQRPIEDFDAATDEPDYPQEWFLSLAYNLAKFSLTKYAPDQARTNLILGLAEEVLRDALASDTETMLRLRPDERGL